MREVKYGQYSMASELASDWLLRGHTGKIKNTNLYVCVCVLVCLVHSKIALCVMAISECGFSFSSRFSTMQSVNFDLQCANFAMIIDSWYPPPCAQFNVVFFTNGCALM